jgi:2'-5' RNA ligase
MVAYQPFIDDPAHINELEGQRFIVLCVPVTISTSYREFQEDLRERLRGLPISYPARAHVTLCGFAAGTSMLHVQRLVGSWALGIRPLRIEVAGLSWFPSPFQIVIVEVRKTPALFAALADLRTVAEKKRLNVSTVMPVDKWRFHMSLAYCSRLSEAEWRNVMRLVETLNARPMYDDVTAAEIVAFDNGQEYSGGTYALGPEEIRTS